MKTNLSKLLAGVGIAAALTLGTANVANAACLTSAPMGQTSGIA